MRGQQAGRQARRGNLARDSRGEGLTGRWLCPICVIQVDKRRGEADQRKKNIDEGSFDTPTFCSFVSAFVGYLHPVVEAT